MSVVVVDAEGRWKIKGEERKGVRSASLEREEAVASKKKAAPVVIELD